VCLFFTHLKVNIFIGFLKKTNLHFSHKIEQQIILQSNFQSTTKDGRTYRKVSTKYYLSFLFCISWPHRHLSWSGKSSFFLKEKIFLFLFFDKKNLPCFFFFDKRKSSLLLLKVDIFFLWLIYLFWISSYLICVHCWLTYFME